MSVPVEISLQRIPVDGGRIVAIARDITERRQAERERELLYGEALNAVRARDEFLSVASHELRTPLLSLQLQIEMLQRPPKDPARPPLAPAQMSEKLAMAARQVEGLISELMDVSRITAGRLQLTLEEVDLAAVARDVVTRFGDEAARAKTGVTLQAEPVVGRWDRLRMDQILTNLLTNALKFGEGQPVEVTVAAAGATARLTVRDHGIGIAPEDLARIFQRFERVTSARKAGGMGLGLYIVRQVVEAHGGTVRAESQPGAGATFTVELPREPLPARKTDAPPPAGGDRVREGGAEVHVGEAHPDR